MCAISKIGLSLDKKASYPEKLSYPVLSVQPTI